MIVDWLTLAAFMPAVLALNLTPGADMMFTLAQGMKGGIKAGMAANFGIAAGCVVHLVIAAFGLAALLKAYPLAFEVIRWGGVAYLLYLAWKSFFAPAPNQAKVVRATPLAIFKEALMVNLLNPKVALFILAFLPQFIVSDRAVLPQFLILGTVLCTGGLIVNGCVALFAGRLGEALARSDRFAIVLNRVSAGVFSLLALRLAMMERA